MAPDNHIDYAVEFIGIDPVGIASDSDGGGIDGWDSPAEACNVMLELFGAATRKSKLESYGAVICCASRRQREGRPETEETTELTTAAEIANGPAVA